MGWQADPSDSVALAVERAHDEIWRRFIHEQEGYGIVLDYAGLDGSVSLPTPEECREGKPNALAWWCPAENGAFFNGLYVDGLINRWKATGEEQDRIRAEKIALGLLRLGEVGDCPGFVARGIAADGSGHHLIGSDDQTAPWFYGLWKYARSDLCSPEMKKRIVRAVAAAAEAILRLRWRLPCDGEFYAYRGDWRKAGFIHAARLLFMLKVTGELTGDRKWGELYVEAGEEKPEGAGKTRFQWCEAGLRDEPGSRYESDLLTQEVCAGRKKARTGGSRLRKYPYWTSASAQACLRELRELEHDESRKLMFAAGLNHNAERALAYIGKIKYTAYDNDNEIPFEIDWRFLNAWWKRQESVEDAVAVAEIQSREWHERSPRKVYEAQYVREPLWAAWFVVLGGDSAVIRRAREPIRRLLTQYEWGKLYLSLFFIGECVYYEWLKHEAR